MKKALALGTFGLLTLAATSAMAATRLVKGKLYYEDYHLAGEADGMLQYNGTKPIRSIVVTIKVNGNKVGSAPTNDAGELSTAIDTALLPAGGKVTLELQAYKKDIADVYLDLDGDNHQLTWGSSQVTILAGTTDIVVPKHTVTKDNMAAHFNILDAIQYGRSWAGARRDGGDGIGEVDVQYPDADGNQYKSIYNEIWIKGPPSPWGYGTAGAPASGFGDRTILHEYAHHLQHDISDVDGSGLLNHQWCTDHGAELSWREGFPNYFAKAVASTVSALTVPHDYESLSGCGPLGTEAAVVTSLWDIHDDPGQLAEDHDRMIGSKSTPQGPIRDLIFKIFDNELDDGGFFSDPSTNIGRFHDAFVARKPYDKAHADLDLLLSFNKAPPSHQFCAYAVNNVSPAAGAAITGAAFTVTSTLANNSTFYYTDFNVTVETYTLAPNKVTLDKTTIAQFAGTKTLTRGVIFPSWLPAGSYPVYVELDPENAIPEAAGEVNKNSTVPWVTVVKCGDGVCSAAESCATCSADCGTCCGDGSCDLYWGENCGTCTLDCGSCEICGDGSCDFGEDFDNCPNDCFLWD